MTSRLHVAEWGHGPDVVFLHGLGASSRYWEPLAEAGGEYHGVAPDLLGFGRSPSPSDAAYDVASHLEALEPILPPRALIVGHSMGAILAAALAARHPERVSGLVLLGLPAYPDEDSARASVGGLGLLARLTADGRPSARRICRAMCRVRPLAIALAPIVIHDLTPSVASDGARHTWESYSRSLRRIVLEHRASDDLAATNVPVDLVHGNDDRSAPLAFVRSLVERSSDRRPALRLHVLRGDHHVAIHQPAAVAAILTNALLAAGNQ